MLIRLDDIILNGNVRVETGNVSTLAASMSQIGQLQPVLVTPSGDESGTFQLIAGHRRYEAALSIGWDDIECYIDESFSDASSVIVAQLIENRERLDLTPWEEMQVSFDLKAEGMNQGEIADVLSITKGTVSKSQKVVKSLQLDEDLSQIETSQLSYDALNEIAESDAALAGKASLVIEKIVSGDSHSVWAALNSVNTDVKAIAFYEEIGPLQKEWSEMGVQVTATDPHYHWDKTDQYDQRKIDTKVERVESYSLEVNLIDHIKLDCHMIWISDGSSGYGGTPSVTHWCMNKNLHTEKGKSELKVEGAAKIQKTKEAESTTRREIKEAKAKLRLQTRKWLSSRFKTADVLELALPMAVFNDRWREDHTREAIWVLGFVEERPTGAEYSWYQNRLNKYLKEEFGDDERTILLWKVRFLAAYSVISGFSIDRETEKVLAAIDVE